MGEVATLMDADKVNFGTINIVIPSTGLLHIMFNQPLSGDMQGVWIYYRPEATLF